jgi:hypothetical protein
MRGRELWTKISNENEIIERCLRKLHTSANYDTTTRSLEQAQASEWKAESATHQLFIDIYNAGIVQLLKARLRRY